MPAINFLIISEDTVLKEIIHRLICKKAKGVNFISLQSFAKLKKLKNDTKIDVVVLDDSISGTAHYEVITYLRYEKEIVAPIYFFSPADYIEKHAYENGVNFFFKKPFDPIAASEHILSTLQSIQ